MTVWRMCIERYIPKATDTHSEYVILIAFPLQQWLHERALILRLYVHSISRNIKQVPEEAATVNFRFV